MSTIFKSSEQIVVEMQKKLLAQDELLRHPNFRSLDAPHGDIPHWRISVIPPDDRESRRHIHFEPTLDEAVVIGRKLLGLDK